MLHRALQRTTKPAPHLDGVHVVFGLVISGFEVIEQIENLKTDAASRPYADVRVIDCGVLATKLTKDVFEKKKEETNLFRRLGLFFPFLFLFRVLLRE